MSEKWDVVDVWVCRFPSEEAVEVYFEETYGQEEDVPISAFAADMGHWYYDHDFVYREFHDPPAQALEEALERCPQLEGVHPQLLEAFRASPLSPFNLFLVAFGREIEEPKSIELPDRNLHYLGRFENAAAE